MRAEEALPPARVEVLGPLRLVVDGVVVDVRGPKRRAVLALLAFAEGRTATVDHLVDALWPSDVPESGRQALHTHVSRLRAHLGSAAARLETRHDGYRLELGGDDLDVARARVLLARARTGTQRDPAGAFALLQEAGKRRKRCAPDASTGTGWSTRPDSTRHRRWASWSATSPVEPPVRHPPGPRRLPGRRPD